MLWHYCFSTLAFVVPLAGIGLNFFVLCKLRKIARLNLFRFETSSALPLAAMSVCDSICLLALFAQAVFHVVLKLHSKDSAANDVAVADSGGGRASSLEQHGASMFCKIDLYLLHTTSAFSVWCWLVLSILRYTAVFHPFRYRLIWRQP
ncbi:Protein AH9.4, partial [Aphelenchoides avenae]